MTSFTKIIFRLSPLGIVLLIVAVYHSSNDYKYIDAEESTVKLQVFRHRRAINPATVLRYCKLNQYYDQEEGRCLGVPGGGKVLHVENGRSCGVNILKPHCTSLLYYHICKRDKSILAQCPSRQIFDNRLQRCAYYDSSSLTPSIIRPDDREYYEHLVGVPNCTRPGRFPVPDHCSMFYTCDTNGHRLHQSVFKCPRNTGYQANREVCAVVSDCENNDSVDSAVCVPDAPGENVQSLNSDDATETNVEGTTETSEESETRSLNDFASKKEESINSKTYDNIISTTSESITDNPLSDDNYGGNDGDLDKASALSTQPIQDISVSDSTGEILNQAVNPTESAREVQNEKEDSISPLDLQITSPPTVELDAPHSVMTPTTLTPVYSTDINSNVDSEIADTPFSTVSYRSSKLDERTLNITTEQYRSNDDGTVTLPNSNTEALDPYSASTVSNVPEFPPISETSSKLYEETRDVTGAVDSYQTSTISTVPESSPIIDTPLDEKMQDTTTDEYKNNDETVLNSNTEAIDPYSASTISNVSEFPPNSETSSKLYEETRDVTGAVDSYQTSTISNIPESSPIIDTPSKLDEETQDTTTDEYRNNDDETVLNSNSTEAIDPYSASTISNVSEFPPNSETSSKLYEETRDVTGAVDSYQTSTISNIPESSPIIDTPSTLDEETQDTTTDEYRNNDDETVLNSNSTEAIDPYSASTISNVPEFPPISETPSKLYEETRDVTGAVDSYQTSTISNIPESSPIIDTPSKLDEETQDTTTDEYRNNDDETVLNSNSTEAIDPYSASTISNVPEFSPISETPSKLYEETRDVTGAVDSYQTSTISNIPESSPIIDTPSKLDEETQDTTTDEYRNNDDETVLNSNTEAIDPYSASTISNVPEFPPISETSSKLYEETQSATTEQYGNDDRIMTPSNSNPEMIDQNPTSILSDISATTDSPSNDFDTSPSTLTSAILSPQTDINDDQYATKELFTSPSVDSKLVDPDLDAPEAIENVSTGYSSKHTDTLDLATTESTLTQEHIPASMDITTIIPTKQDFPAISDTDLMTQNGKDSTEASPFIEQDAPITNN